MVEISGKEVDEVVKKDSAVVIDCWAPWCPTCRMMMPNIEKLEEDNSNIKFYKINMDENQDFAKSHDVFSLPTLLFYKDGGELERTTGFKQKVQINAILDKIR